MHSQDMWFILSTLDYAALLKVVHVFFARLQQGDTWLLLW